MRYKYEILAAHRPFMDYYEESCKCSTFWSAMMQLRKYKKQGYEIINISYRKPIKIDISNWDQITMCRGD